MVTSTRHAIKNYAFLDAFTCVGADCEDTCCVGWGMQVDSERKKLYQEKAPELLNSITTANPNDTNSLIMKRDPQTDYCVKFEDGLCGIQKRYGEEFLGDACHFFPRITRSFTDTTLVAASLSCPEIAKLALFSPDPFILKEHTLERLPVNIKNYLPGQLTSNDALTIIQAFLEVAGDVSITPEHALERIITVSKSLDNIDITRWKEAISFLVRTADTRVAEPIEELADPYRLLHALAGLIAATKRPKHPRLMHVFTTIEKALDAHIDWETIEITTNDTTLSAAIHLKELWHDKAENEMFEVMRKWLQTQLAMASFPFSGLGNTLFERIAIIAVRFATVKLALMSYLKVYGALPDNKTIVEIVQSLSRFMDHLSDPTLSLAIYTDAGWTREGRLLSLLGKTNKVTNKQKVT